MTVIIAGAGITGLTLAISCHQAGIPFRIFEQVSEIRPLGVGINVQPHAVRELFEMGLEAEMDATGVRTREVAYFSKKGKQIWSEPRGQFAGYKWPQFSVHRGKFQMMLFNALEARAGKGTVVTGREAVDCKDVDGGVIVTFRDRQGNLSTPISVRNSIPAKARRTGAARSCGGAPRGASPSSPRRPWAWPGTNGRNS